MGRPGKQSLEIRVGMLGQCRKGQSLWSGITDKECLNYLDVKPQERTL